MMPFTLICAVLTLGLSYEGAAASPVLLVQADTDLARPQEVEGPRESPGSGSISFEME